MQTKENLSGQITGLINSNAYLSDECGNIPEFAPVLQLIIDDNNRQISELNEQLNVTRTKENTGGRQNA